MSNGHAGHMSILKNISGCWTLYCRFCSFKKNWPVPAGKVFVENGNLVNLHPLGKLILFDGREKSFLRVNAKQLIIAFYKVKCMLAMPLHLQ